MDTRYGPWFSLRKKILKEITSFCLVLLESSEVVDSGVVDRSYDTCIVVTGDPGTLEVVVTGVDYIDVDLIHLIRV